MSFAEARRLRQKTSESPVGTSRQSLEGPAPFPTTIWSLVAASARGEASRTSAAAEQLCALYWRPLYAFLRRQGIRPEDAQDLVQGFLARFIARGDAENTDPNRGKFRTYLIAGLRNFTLKQVEHDRADKRGGKHEFIPLDPVLAERLSVPDLGAPTPEATHDRQLARILLARALHQLREEQEKRGKADLFARVESFLDGAAPQDYVVAARDLGVTPNRVAVTVHRLRGRLRELLREEIATWAGSRSETESELRELLQALSQS